MTSSVPSSQPSSSTDRSEQTDVLHQVVAAYETDRRDRPSAAAVVEALLQAEKTAKQQRLLYPFESLLGRWQLCFATGTRKVRQRGGIVLGKGFYVPRFVPAHLSFTTESAGAGSPNYGEIGNQIRLGSLRVKFVGPCRYEGKKNLLAFDFTQLQVWLFDRLLYQQPIRGRKSGALDFAQQPIAKLPFFAFFWISDRAIAARGRGGGLAIWIRDTDEGNNLSAHDDDRL